MHHNDRGYSLVELAIVMVAFGLILSAMSSAVFVMIGSSQTVEHSTIGQTELYLTKRRIYSPNVPPNGKTGIEDLLEAGVSESDVRENLFACFTGRGEDCTSHNNLVFTIEDSSIEYGRLIGLPGSNCSDLDSDDGCLYQMRTTFVFRCSESVRCHRVDIELLLRSSSLHSLRNLSDRFTITDRILKDRTNIDFSCTDDSEGVVTSIGFNNLNSECFSLPDPSFTGKLSSNNVPEPDGFSANVQIPPTTMEIGGVSIDFEFETQFCSDQDVSDCKKRAVFEAICPQGFQTLTLYDPAICYEP